MKRAKAIPILMYHHVSPHPGLVTISPALFHEHMKALKEHGWRTAGLNEIERFLNGDAIPAKTCIITFDDGYLDNFVYAAPALREFGHKAVLFIVTGWIGEGPVREGTPSTYNHNECKQRIRSGDADSVMLRWSEVSQLQDQGVFEFHSHTHTHTRWDQVLSNPTERYAALANDLANSRKTLEAQLGNCSAHLCWPQGFFDEQYIATATAHGFNQLYTTKRQVTVSTTSACRIGRINADKGNKGWLISRLNIYSRPFLARLYSSIKGVA